MAEQSTHDVVNQARSVGDLSPSDVSALKPNDSNVLGDLERTTALTNTHETFSSEPEIHSDVGAAEIVPRPNGIVSEAITPETGNVSLNGARCSGSS